MLQKQDAGHLPQRPRALLQTTCPPQLLGSQRTARHQQRRFPTCLETTRRLRKQQMLHQVIPLPIVHAVQFQRASH